MKSFRLDPNKSALLIVDVQVKLFPLVERPCEMMEKQVLLVKGCKLAHVPVYATEQYTKGLGETIDSLKSLIDSKNILPEKTSFSGASRLPDYKQWIIAGIETHVCVQQTVFDLIQSGKEVVVVNDATSSRSIYDFATAIAEMRDFGARVSSTESVIFELLQDSKHPNFKSFSQLIK
ncbi:MAG: isochorismatase family protein [Parachlamydiaceae bacterium]